MADEKHGLSDLNRRTVYNCFLTSLHFVRKWEKKSNKRMLVPNMFSCLSTDTTSCCKWSDWDVRSLWSMTEDLFSVLRETFFPSVSLLNYWKITQCFFFSQVINVLKLTFVPERTLNSIHFKYSSGPLLNNFHFVELSSLFPLCFPDILSVLSQNQKCRGWKGL